MRNFLKTLYEQRRANTKDLIELSELILSIKELKINNEPPFRSPEELEFAIKNRNAVFLVNIEQDEIVGFLYGTIDTPYTACITYLGVRSDWRGKGIGKSLVVKFIKVVNELHYSIEHVYALTTNSEATAFFRKVGLKPKSDLTYVSGSFDDLWDKFSGKKNR